MNERLSVAVTSLTPRFAEVIIKYDGFMNGLALLLVYTPVRYLQNGRLCNQIIFKAECLIGELAQLPRQVLEARRVAVVKLFSKSMLKYVFFARGLALYVNSSVDILHVSLRACVSVCVRMRYAVLRETLSCIQFKLFNLLNPNSNFLLWNPFYF